MPVPEPSSVPGDVGADDRRREARLSPGDVECDIEGAQVVHVLGISIEGHGMRVMTDHSLQGREGIPIALHVAPDETLHFSGRVVWEKAQNFEFTRRYITGLQFVSPDPAATERLHRFVEEFLAREHPELRAGGSD